MNYTEKAKISSENENQEKLYIEFLKLMSILDPSIKESPLYKKYMKNEKNTLKEELAK